MQISCKFDSQAFLQAVEKIPAKLQEEIEVALETAAAIIQEEAAENHGYKEQSGALTRSIQFVVNPYNLTASVYLDEGIAPYGPYLHQGTGRYGPKRREYLIKPKNKECLRWSRGNKFCFAKQVIHPGIKPDPFLYLAARKKEKEVRQVLESSVNRVLKEEGF